MPTKNGCNDTLGLKQAAFDSLRISEPFRRYKLTQIKRNKSALIEKLKNVQKQTRN